MPTRPIAHPAFPASLLRRRAAGFALMLAGGAVMALWLALCGTVAAVTFGGRALAALPATVVQAIDHMGDHAYGL